MKQKWMRISHKDYVKGNYAHTTTHSELTNPHDGSSSVTVHEALVYQNDDGSINEEMTYGKKAQKTKTQKPEKESVKNNSQKEGFLKKILLAPFRLLWKLVKWLLKTILIIVSAGLLKDFLEGDDK